MSIYNYNTKMETITTIDEPKKRTYMREYKRKKYAENGDDIKAKNKAYYYKYKFGLNGDDMKKYDILLPLVSKLRKGLDELKEKNPEFLKEVLEMYNV